jgi:hypothetical protein
MAVDAIGLSGFAHECDGSDGIPAIPRPRARATPGLGGCRGGREASRELVAVR